MFVTPQGRLGLEPGDTAPPFDREAAERLESAFARGPGHGLLQLGAGEIGTALPPVLSFWRDLGARYVTALCTLPEAAQGDLARQDLAGKVAPARPAPPPEEEIEPMAEAAPPMTGTEYVTAGLLRDLWGAIDTALAAELSESRAGVQDFLKRHNPAWNLVGRVHFHLAENKGDGEAPFAFLATYTTRLSRHAQAQHLPLGQALREYAGAAKKDRLLALLLPVQRAATTCPWLKEMLDSGEVFHPLRWLSREALQLLRDVPRLQEAGIAVRMPASWVGNRPLRPLVTATIGGRAPSVVGRDALLDFDMAVTIEGAALTSREVEELLAGTEEMALIRGRWVEIDRERLRRTIEQFRSVQRAAADDGLGFGEAMRLLAGADIANGADGPGGGAGGPAGGGLAGGGEVGGDGPDWSRVVAGPWLSETLKGLRSPQGLARVDPGAALRDTLRPYQHVGLRWLYLLSRLGLGACLADDMGLGKTIQVLALLQVLKSEAADRERSDRRKPSLLVAPASLLANWASEIERFAPRLRALVAHPSAMPAAEVRTLAPERLAGIDLVMTSYGSLHRLPWLTKTSWDLVVLDEAQAIKNPAARQTRAAKTLKARARFALSGTPIENRLGDLWSIFDFINPGLLGSSKEFSGFVKRLARRPHNPYAPLRELVRPYILRRLKTDKTVIADLPDKTEVKAFCPLSRRQAALYAQAVNDLKAALAAAEGIQRRGIILAYLMRLKQICNHPSQWLRDGAWAEKDSGKWTRLREIAEVIAAKQEKVLVFTQFREVTEPVAAFLGSVFGAPGLVLHGATAVGKRQELVRHFQEDDAVRYFVLSLKTGGAGLNLTAAAHVVHFDRWWNPAVENQATDRAFRIGQTRNVLVHKFVCRGTVEERIDRLIESKRALSRDLLEGGVELLLTEMKDDELLDLVALDINAALKEA
ncbi:MAG TPA: DEAD/DEAH box helicase [Candidatus Dormibacteraeota bacterium]|nr:DEAD/DEAH box helicase [Candidatus Dormibacteraeota bacterium]